MAGTTAVAFGCPRMRLAMRLAFRQNEVERGPLARRALAPYPTAVARDEALHHREPDAVARKFVLGMQPLEHAEELPVVARVETYAVVAHGIDGFRPLLARAHLDDRMVPGAAELHGVG